MTKRPLTPEERKLWHESNRLTTVKREVEEELCESNATNSASPLAGEATRLSASALSRSGEGALKSGKSLTPRPLTQPSPARGEGSSAAPLAPLKGLSAREAKRAFKPHAIGATLDLHGLTKLEAYAQVEAFIRQQHRSGRRHVAIITGKGRTGGEAGVLRTNLPHWLNEPALRPLISAFAYAKPEKGGVGVTHVLLKSR